jgi:hypothetical protein
MKEEDAKKKWCPLCFAAHEETDMHCVGSSCMAWVMNLPSQKEGFCNLCR